MGDKKFLRIRRFQGIKKPQVYDSPVQSFKGW